MSAREHVERDLADHGIVNPTEEQLDDFQLEIQPLYHFFSEKECRLDYAKVREFKEENDRMKKIELLTKMTVYEIIRCLYFESDDNISKAFEKRLRHYNMLAQGYVRKPSERQDLNDYIPADWSSNLVHADNMKVGLLRDAVNIAMRGTPESAIYRVADSMVKKNKNKRLGSTQNMLETSGTLSGIHEDSIGYAWPLLASQYTKALEYVARTNIGEPPTAKELEKRAIKVAATWIAEGVKYYDGYCNPAEAVAIGQLDDDVRKRVLHLRQAMGPFISFRNLDRFIGFSGDSPYAKEMKDLREDISAMKSYLGPFDLKYAERGYRYLDKNGKRLMEDDAAQAFADDWNERDLVKQKRWLESETARLENKFEKEKNKILSLDLPAEERNLQLESWTRAREKALSEAKASFDKGVAEITHRREPSAENWRLDAERKLRARGPNELLADMEARYASLEDRFEKRKSLADKAIDLHFVFNYSISHNKEEDDYEANVQNQVVRPYIGVIDWINDAPLSVIQKAHDLHRRGLPDEVVMAYSLTSMMVGKEWTRDEYDLIKKALKDGTNLQALLEVSKALKQHQRDCSLSDKLFLTSRITSFGAWSAQLSFARMAEIFPVNELKIFAEKGLFHAKFALELESYCAEKKIRLDAETIWGISACGMTDFEDFKKALRHFPDDLVKSLERLQLHYSQGIAYDEFEKCGHLFPGLKSDQALIDEISKYEENFKVIILHDPNIVSNNIVALRQFLTPEEINTLLAKNKGLLPLAEAISRHEYFGQLKETKNIFAKHGYENFIRKAIDDIAPASHWRGNGKNDSINGLLQELCALQFSLDKKFEFTQEEMQAINIKLLKYLELLRQADDEDKKEDLLDVLNRLFTNPDKIYQKAKKDFGEFLNSVLYGYYCQLSNDVIPEDLREMGVTKAGHLGMAQFSEKLRNFQNSMIVNMDMIPQSYFNSPLIKQKFKSMVRYDSSYYGNHDDNQFNKTIQTYYDLKSTKSIEPLNPAYTPSPTLQISKIDQAKRQNFVYTEAFRNRFSTIVYSLMESRYQHIYNFQKGFDDLLLNINNKIKEVSDAWEHQLADQPAENAQNNIRWKLAIINSVLEEPLTPEEKFNRLSRFGREFDKELMDLFFFMGYSLNPQFSGKEIEKVDLNHPKADDITWVLDFVDHVVNRETFAKYFSNKEAAKNFRNLVNVSALEQEINRLQQAGMMGTMDMKFVPVRNLLMEFTGHMADACWASKYGSMLKAFPNFTGLVMVQNPGKDAERVGGAAMLIEADSNNGEKLLIIRGLNPIENVINQLSVNDFFEKMVGYLRGLAEKSGRKLAIVIDGRRGGSASNRQSVYNLLAEMKKTLQPVRLASSEKTTFNNHNIVNNCYLL